MVVMKDGIVYSWDVEENLKLCSSPRVFRELNILPVTESKVCKGWGIFSALNATYYLKSSLYFLFKKEVLTSMGTSGPKKKSEKWGRWKQ